jgi:single-stranded-DNA-specific exonuclease
MRVTIKKYIMKHWKFLSQNSKLITHNSVDDIVNLLLANRNITSKKGIETFLNPNLKKTDLTSCGIDAKEFKKFKIRIEKAIKNEEKIIIFGDYDVDGITSCAILWETLYARTKYVVPYIPDRADEGYGLSKKGIENVLKENPDTKIIITVDNGIVAYDAVDFANEKGIEVIITDHHVKGKKLPKAFCIIHTTSLCGGGIAWVLAKELAFQSKKEITEKLELATLATIADLVPLTNDNRAIVKEGLELLKKTQRVGLIELLKEAGISNETLGVYSIGHAIAPRLNATGRIQSAMNALRLLCTRDPKKARDLAQMLGGVNRDRQGLTEESVNHAKLLAIENSSPHITIVSDASYNQGIIGLVASQLVEVYYKPAIAIAVGSEISKGSARSINGVNIIELLRSVSDTLLETGGHPMAAGFSLVTERIEEFKMALEKKASEIVTDELLKRYLNIDLMIPFSIISMKLYDEIEKLAPYGMGNPEPVFATEKVNVVELRKIGREQNHLKLKLESDGKTFDAVAFKMADKVELSQGDLIDVAYVIDKNEWNGKVNLQLKIRDIKLS